MKIGELAGCTGYTVEAIRHYESAGLMPKPARTASNYRQYGPQHLERLQFIRHCRSLDMALDEIRTLLAVRDAPDQRCGAVNAMLDQHITQVSQRIAELRALEQQLKDIRGLCGQNLAARDCAILQCLGGVVEQKS
ncbi:Cd(II)/Pb(II)-responsive transcriptional regulator [Duganella sp. sic0402]|uniref:Cd(II)/Pb(II)-responsive transcriptional regulator n=1 Tax=Duganella sp. sic0402 TaxID=2854786 RepID=UPI001C44C965|nr:Cd(II)/Pb(II)-responsive transcriptional regulator [Duganella sp. sic0402]MBV7537567.1 Cd(II)/Pb(II)-responsive transcriptional regulator [Duganella sp. sic0402]